jgi:hypothetical protein
MTGIFPSSISGYRKECANPLSARATAGNYLVDLVGFQPIAIKPLIFFVERSGIGMSNEARFC